MNEVHAEQAKPARPSPSEASDAAHVTVIVEVQGGLVQTAYASDPLTAVHVLDRDCQRDGDITDEEANHYRSIEALTRNPGMHLLW